MLPGIRRSPEDAASAVADDGPDREDRLGLGIWSVKKLILARKGVKSHTLELNGFSAVPPTVERRLKRKTGKHF